MSGPAASAAMAIRPPDDRAFEPGSIPEALSLAKILVSSHLLPRSVATAEAAFAIIATGRELGLSAMQSLRSIHVIEGKPTLSADLILALCKQRRDTCDWFRMVESTETIATYETLRKGEPSPTKLSFTLEDAQRAGVATKDNWRKYPAAMLRARCIAALARIVYPDLALGLYDPDEFEPERGDPAVIVSSTPNAPTAPAQSTEVTEAFKILLDAIDNAETVAQLNGIAKQIQMADRAGQLSGADVAALRIAFSEARGPLTAERPSEPKAPPREPGDDAEEDGGAP